MVDGLMKKILLVDERSGKGHAGTVQYSRRMLPCRYYRITHGVCYPVGITPYGILTEYSVPGASVFYKVERVPYWSS